MEKTRTDKYKKYREGVANGEETEVKDDYDEDRDDDFLSFIPGQKEEEEEEEELHPLSYDTLKNDETVTNALRNANAKNDYDTKMDILNRLKENKSDRVNLDQFNTTNLSEGHEVGAKGESVSLVDKLETMDDTFKSQPIIKEPKPAPAKKPEVKKPEVKKPEVKPEVKAEPKKENKDLIDESSFKTPVMKEHEPVTLSRKEIKALKKQEKTARKLEKEEEKAAKKALAQQKKANELAEKEKKKQAELAQEKAKVEKEALEKAEVKQEKEEAYQERSKDVKVKKPQHSLLSRILDLILIILIIIILVMVVFTAVSIM